MKPLRWICLFALMGFAVPTRASCAAPADIQGEWAIEFDAGSVHNEDDMQMYVIQEGARLTGHIEWNSSATDYPIKGTITDDQFEIVWTTSVNGVISQITFKGTIKGEELNGTAVIPERGEGDFYARRTGK
jgi:hypothetical protein